MQNIPENCISLSIHETAQISVNIIWKIILRSGLIYVKDSKLHVTETSAFSNKENKDLVLLANPHDLESFLEC